MRLVLSLFLFLAAPAALSQPTDATPSKDPALTLNAPSPNPTDGRAVFVLSVSAPGHVTVEAFDLLGRRTATLFSDALPATARQHIAFDGARLPDGLYLIVARSETMRVQRVVTLAR